MKKKVFILVMLAALLVLALGFFGCSNPSGGDNDDDGGVVTPSWAIGGDAAYTFNSDNSNRSARALTIENVYRLTIVRARPQNKAGAVENVDSETIDATVKSKTVIGNNREKYELERLDDQKKFYVTFENDGTIFSIQGLAGVKGLPGEDEAFLTPLGDNSNSLNGFYVGFMEMYTGFYDPFSTAINGNEMLVTVYVRDDCNEIDCPECAGGNIRHRDGWNDSLYTFTVEGNTIHIDSVQKVRSSTGGWIPMTKSDGYEGIKTLTFTLSGDEFTSTVTEEYGTIERMKGVVSESKRIPTPMTLD